MSVWDGIEKRRFVRVRLHCTANIKDLDGLSISTYAEEISEKGVKVSIKRQLQRLTRLELEIYLRPEPLICKGKVVWVKKTEGDYLEGGVIFDTGIELYDLKEEDKKLLKKLVVQAREEDKLV